MSLLQQKDEMEGEKRYMPPLHYPLAEKYTPPSAIRELSPPPILRENRYPALSSSPFHLREYTPAIPFFVNIETSDRSLL